MMTNAVIYYSDIYDNSLINESQLQYYGPSPLRDTTWESAIAPINHGKRPRYDLDYALTSTCSALLSIQHDFYFKKP